MAQKIIQTLIDDLDGSQATECVNFGLDGVAYEIDLNREHAERLRAALAEFIAVARRTGGRQRGKAIGRPNREVDMKSVREWARHEGYDISDRGRIPQGIVEEYMASGKPSPLASPTSPAKATGRRRAPKKVDGAGGKH